MVRVDVTETAQHGIPAGVKLTPMMQQYVAAKARYPDALLFFRMGDFYEMFYEDAELGGRHLDLTVTSRDKESSVPAPMSGFPHHQLAPYLARALEAGLKVAVCDQLEDASLAKGLVRRGITRVVTPGVVMDDESLDARANNFLVAVVPVGAVDGEAAGFAVAALDVSTGEFRATEVMGQSALRCELGRVEPRELLLPPEGEGVPALLGERLRRVAVSRPGADFFSVERARAGLRGLIGPTGEKAADELESYGFAAPLAVLRAAGAAVAYVVDTQQRLPDHTRLLTPYRVHDTLVLDETAKTNLELFRTLMEGRKRGSLLGVMDRAATAMGGRRLRQWMAFPLMDPARIGARLDAVEWLVGQAEARGRVRAALKEMYDLERLNGRIAAGTAGPRDLWTLRLTLEQVPAVLDPLIEAAPLRELLGRIDPLDEVVELVAAALVDDPPGQLKDGGVIRPGFQPELDELVDLSTSGKDWILDLEASEREATGIASLKVRYNKVFGYFIEVRRGQVDRVPGHYIRKQTLANAERYFTEELKAFEDKVLNAESRRSALEADLFAGLRDEVASFAARIAGTASALADLDALCSLAELAHRNGYCRPEVDDGDVIDLEEARHPVVEEAVGREAFVPNSLCLDREARTLVILTGPNMAGKSTVMRQVALITLMAQMGSFVPARRARIGVVDRIFTRVGAADDLAAGRSTFMVEMHETATILREASARSLLILDEIGRGTSTFDGVSIAWAVAEHIHDVIGAKTLFATHYHELVDLAEVKPRVVNYTIAVKEWNDEVIFLRQLVEGGASRSYGIQVARLAGLPSTVIERSKQVLNNLQISEHDEIGRPRLAHDENFVLPEHNIQLSLFAPPPIPAAPSKVEQSLRAADLNNLSPIQALNLLHALRAQLEAR
ncbi:MAG: DNA mismatch repair protein MutS [Myxococcales bacterium]|nr:DNA mismatch repair protein MutS [Myxococcales bacterium]